MSVAAVDFALYVIEFTSQGSAQVAVPVLERLSTILLLAWMLAVARAVQRLRVQPPARQTVQGSARDSRLVP